LPTTTARDIPPTIININQRSRKPSGNPILQSKFLLGNLKDLLKLNSREFYKILWSLHINKRDNNITEAETSKIIKNLMKTLTNILPLIIEKIAISTLLIYKEARLMRNNLPTNLHSQNKMIQAFFTIQWPNASVIKILTESNKDLICFKRTFKTN
jgi:hypothetical protein